MKRVGPVCEASSSSKLKILASSKMWKSEVRGRQPAAGSAGQLGARAQGSSEAMSEFPFCHHQDVHPKAHSTVLPLGV